MNKKQSFLFIFITFIFLTSESKSAQQIKEVNYFASLRANETNVRSGPGVNYPVKYSFKIKNIPVRVISEYDNWYEIEDYEKTKGWVAQSLITKKRYIMIYSKKNMVEMMAKKDTKSKKIVYVENYVIGNLLKCEGSWCAVKIDNKKGWILAEDLFGIDSSELK